VLLLLLLLLQLLLLLLLLLVLLQELLVAFARAAPRARAHAALDLIARSFSSPPICS